MCSRVNPSDFFLLHQYELTNQTALLIVHGLLGAAGNSSSVQEITSVFGAKGLISKTKI
jgi:hypothetical protein